MEDMPHILVFKTNLRWLKDEKKIKPLLEPLPAIKSWNIDRQDPDKILRIESSSLCQDDIINAVKLAGYHCEELNDKL